MVTDNTSFIDQTESVEAPKPDNTGEAAKYLKREFGN